MALHDSSVHSNYVWTCLIFLKPVAGKACKEVFSVSGVLVLSEIVSIFRPHPPCMNYMGFCDSKSINFQWTG